MEKSSAQDDKVIEFLELMIKKLERGWIQGSMFEYNSNYDKCCLIGAAVKVFTENPKLFSVTYPYALWDIQSCIEDLGFEDDGTQKTYVAQFNDTPGRTQEEVIDVVKCAIENRKKEIDL